MKRWNNWVIYCWFFVLKIIKKEMFLFLRFRLLFVVVGNFNKDILGELLNLNMRFMLVLS